MSLLIGSHCSLKAPDFFLGTVKEALSYDATTFMFYTGAPQNTRRRPVSEMKVEEGLALMEEHGIDRDKVVVHAPYIINLANTIKPETFELAVSFLKEEISRCEQMGMTRLVLHPGSHVKAGVEVGLDQIVAGLNMVLTPDQNVRIALETMAGKGSELGRTPDELAYIINHVLLPDKLGICMDTCHLNDAGYDMHDFDSVLDEFDEKIGLDKVLVVHVNDSKNPPGAAKDRHDNLGYGTIGFDALCAIVHNERLKDVPKILETPYIGGNAPYKAEIAALRAKQFNPDLK